METSEKIDYLVRNLCHDNGKAFAERIGVPGSSVSKWRHGGRNPSYATLEKILAAYPQVRREWLMHGKGKAFKETRIKSDTDLLRRVESLEKNMAEVRAMMEKYR